MPIPSSNPLVSVIIPTYNYARYVGDAILSVLNQDYRPLEILVVDDGSTDNTKEVVEQLVKEHPEVRYFYQKNQGPAAARNYAIRESRGEYLALLDADDVWEPFKTSRQMEYINNGADAVTALCQPYWSSEVPVEKQHRIPASEALPHGSSAFIVSRAVVDRVGFFNESYVSAEWIEWMTRAKEAGIKIQEFPEALVKRRIHLTNNSRRAALDRLQVIKEHLQRKRSQNAQPTAE